MSWLKGLPNVRRVSRRRRQPDPMQEDVAEIGFLTLDWLALYGQDETFQRDARRSAAGQVDAIQQLLELSGGRNPWPLPPVQEQAPPLLVDYMASLERFVTHWQLHLLPGRRGYEMAHAFCVEYVRHNMHPKDFAGLYWFSSHRSGPGPDTAISFGTAAWDPTAEPMAKARARIMAEVAQRIDAEMERVTLEYEHAGYVFPKTRSEQLKYLQWLYWKAVQGLSNNEIAERAPPPADSESVDDDAFINANTVINKTKIVADLLGITIPRRRNVTT